MRIHLLLFAVVAPLVQGETVFKCVDTAGKVTFTQQACPEQSNLSDVVSAHNQRPSADGEAAKMAEKPMPSGIVKKPAGNWNDPPQPVPAKEPATQEKQNDRACAGCAKSKPVDFDQQPCVKVVDKLVSRSYLDKNGNRVGSAETVKVVVPCR